MLARAGQPTLLPCDAVCGAVSEREQCCLLGSLPAFSHFPRYPQANWALLVLVPGWTYVRSRTPWVSPTDSLVRLGVSPTATSTPAGVYSQRFGALFPHWSPGLWVCLAPQLFPLVYLHTEAGPLLRQPPPCLRVLSAWLPVPDPPAHLGECFFFNSLVVGHPYSSIFCQFFVFKFVVILLLFVQGGTMCLPTPPSWPTVEEQFRKW